MVPFLGNINLWLCLFFCVTQAINFKTTNDKNILRIKKISAYCLLLCSLISFFSLMYSYVYSDFSLINVFQNSHTTKPLLYKVSAVWGNHEGSMLLWILILSIFNFFIFRLINKNNLNFIIHALKSQALITFGFVFFTIFTSNPFDKMDSPQSEGLGFNPILQDPALAIHPPLLYIGYVGFSAVFSLSIATLKLNNDEKILWHLYMKPFVMVSWTFLTIGIMFGSIWAYYELGWGGWWFWDPVENASLMPWLIGTALLHSLIIVEKRKSLQTWVLLLSILCFLLSVVGTFLVRSGILTSVHTFALDPSRGIYILLFLGFLGFYSLTLFGLNSKKYFDRNYFAFFSKEGSILVNNIIMVIVCSTIFLGTIYPLLIEMFTNNKISVGEPFFNSTTIPIMAPAILIMGIGPLLAWEKESLVKVLRKSLPSILVTLIATIIIFLIYRHYSILGIIGIFLAFWIIFNSFSHLITIKTKFSKGMIIAHLGIGLLILGITGSSVWQEEKIVRMNIDNKTQIKNYNVLFKKINEVEEQNYIAIKADFSIYDKNKNFVTKLEPENRFYLVTKNFTTEASIHTNLLRDLYIVLGDGNPQDGWVVRIYYNPLVIWIWIGAFAIFVGGIVTLTNNIKKFKILHL